MTALLILIVAIALIYLYAVIEVLYQEWRNRWHWTDESTKGTDRESR